MAPFRQIDTSSLSYGGTNISAYAGLAQQYGLGGLSLGNGLELGEFLNGTYSIDAIASEDPNQKAAGIQSLVSQAMSIVTKLLGTGEAAEAATEKAKEVADTTKSNTKAASLESTLKSAFEAISGKIDTETGVVNELNDKAAEKQKELEAEKEKIQEIVNQINEAQARLGASTDPEEQKELLALIQNGLLGQLGVSLANVAVLQEAVQGLQTDVEKSVNNIYESIGDAEQTESQGVSEIQQLTSEVVKQAQDKATTEVKAVTNEATGKVLEAESQAASSNLFTVSLAPKLMMAATDQNLAATTRQSCVSTLYSLLQQGIGKIGNASELLGSFDNTIGTAIGSYKDVIENTWNATIEGFGSLNTAISDMKVGEEAQAELNNAVNTDLASLGVTEENKGNIKQAKAATYSGAAGSQTPKVVNPYAQKEQTASPQAPQENDDITFGAAIENAEKDKKQANELITPRVAFGI